MPQLINILTDLVFILLHFFVFFFTYHILGKRILQPAVLFSLVWLLIIVLHFVFKLTLLNELFQLHAATYLVFFIGNVCFSIGSVLANKGFEKNRLYYSNSRPQPVEISLAARMIYLAIILAGLPLYIKASYDIFIASNAVDFFAGLRSELSFNDADIGILKYLMSIAFVAFAFNLYAFYLNRNKINGIIVIITFAALFTYAVFATGRTYFIIILSIYLGVSFFLNPKFSIKKQLGWFGVSFIIFFMLFGLIYGKGGNTENSIKENIRSSSENVGVYLVGSLNALEMQLAQNNAAVDKGDNTLRFFIKIALAIHLIPDRKVNSFINEYVFVPYPTNVFTGYSLYIRDFGKIYAWLMFGIYGAIQTWLFNRALYLKSIRCMFYSSFLISPVLLSFFGDQYLTTFSLWFQLVVITELFLFINRLFIVKKQGIVERLVE
ncbi:MAG: O-antigen polymerase [Ferruginibacter sp.]